MVYIQTSNGQSFTISFDPLDRIEDVKDKIQAKGGIEARFQHLTHNGTELQEGHTVQDYCIGNNSRIYVMLPVWMK